MREKLSVILFGLGVVLFLIGMVGTIIEFVIWLFVESNYEWIICILSGGTLMYLTTLTETKG